MIFINLPLVEKLYARLNLHAFIFKKSQLYNLIYAFTFALTSKSYIFCLHIEIKDGFDVKVKINLILKEKQISKENNW